FPNPRNFSPRPSEKSPFLRVPSRLSRITRANEYAAARQRPRGESCLSHLFWNAGRFPGKVIRIGRYLRDMMLARHSKQGFVENLGIDPTCLLAAHVGTKRFFGY